MRAFKAKWFARFARKEQISDDRLISAVIEIENGLNDGDLGQGLIKKRIGRAGQGKRGGYRTILVYRVKSRVVFVYGFPKSAKANLNALELEAYQKLANVYLSLKDTAITKAINAGELIEVDYHDEKI